MINPIEVVRNPQSLNDQLKTIANLKRINKFNLANLDGPFV